MNKERKFKLREERLKEKTKEIRIGKDGFCLGCFKNSVDTQWHHPWGKDFPVVVSVCIDHCHDILTHFQNQLPVNIRKNQVDKKSRLIFILRSDAIFRLLEAKAFIELSIDMEKDELWKRL